MQIKSRSPLQDSCGALIFNDCCFVVFPFKVRKLGRFLNVPAAFLKRHPFPGPGLAVRVLGDVTEGNALDILRQVCLLYTSIPMLVWACTFALMLVICVPG